MGRIRRRATLKYYSARYTNIEKEITLDIEVINYILSGLSLGFSEPLVAEIMVRDKGLAKDPDFVQRLLYWHGGTEITPENMREYLADVTQWKPDRFDLAYKIGRQNLMIFDTEEKTKKYFLSFKTAQWN